MPTDDSEFHSLTDDQTLFLSFLEAMVIRFTQLFKPCVIPILACTEAFLYHPSWHSRKIGQWCQFLDRSSLVAIDRCQGLPNHKDQLISSIASVTLGSCSQVAANMLPLRCSSSFAKDLEDKLSGLSPEKFKFAYPRSLLHLMPHWGKIRLSQRRLYMYIFHLTHVHMNTVFRIADFARVPDQILRSPTRSGIALPIYSNTNLFFWKKRKKSQNFLNIYISTDLRSRIRLGIAKFVSQPAARVRPPNCFWIAKFVSQPAARVRPSSCFWLMVGLQHCQAVT